MTFEEFIKTYNITLNEEQQAAVRAVNGRVLLLAVPGSGKTTVLIARLGYLVNVCKIPPERLLAVTYTVAATDEMRQRYIEKFGAEQGKKIRFATINSLAAEVVRRYADMRGTTPFPIISAGEQAALYAEIYRDRTEEKATDSVVREISTRVTYIKNAMLTAEQIEQQSTDELDMPEIFRRYGEALNRRRRMDFDDQLRYAFTALKNYPALREHYQNLYLAVSMDEAQDASLIQHEILHLLCGQEKDLFLVGDADQSIYGFKAASPKLLLDFPKVYPDASILRSELNYRSRPILVQTADGFIQGNGDRFPLHIRPAREGDGILAEEKVRDRGAQYERCLSAAREGRETAFLFRNNISALPLMDLLDRAGVPFVYRGENSTFFTHPVVTDVLTILQFAGDQSDGAAFSRIFYRLGLYLKEETAFAAAQRAAHTGRSVLAELLGMGLHRAQQERCKELAALLSEIAASSAGTAVRRILHESPYETYLSKHYPHADQGEILCAIAANTNTLRELLTRLEELSALSAGKADGQDRCGTVLSTIHSAKGLEYDRVFIVDAVDGILPPEPFPKTEEERTALYEERRLFYVAMTRAREELHLFRFTAPGLSTCFTDAALHKESGRRFTFSRPAAAADPELENRMKAFQRGGEVRHRAFGRGTITGREGDLITVRFDSGGVRRLSLRVLLEKDLINLL